MVNLINFIKKTNTELAFVNVVDLKLSTKIVIPHRDFFPYLTPL